MTQVPTDQQPTRGKGDWMLAASMLAEGRGVMETAQAAGVCRTTLWRALGKSGDFARLIERRRAELAAESSGRLDALRALVAGQIEDKVRDGDTRTLLWLAGQLGVVGEKTVLFGRMPAAAEPNLDKIERAASGEDEPAAPLADDGAIASESLLNRLRMGVNHFRGRAERLKEELDALKAAIATGSVSAPVPAAEREAKAVPIVPNQ